MSAEFTRKSVIANGTNECFIFFKSAADLLGLQYIP